MSQKSAQNIRKKGELKSKLNRRLIITMIIWPLPSFHTAEEVHPRKGI